MAVSYLRAELTSDAGKPAFITNGTRGMFKRTDEGELDDTDENEAEVLLHNVLRIGARNVRHL